MDLFNELSLALTLWLQQTFPQLEPLMLLLDAFGRKSFFLLLAPAVYWSIDKQLGKQLGYLLLAAVLLNSLLKNTFRLPRPYWIIPELGLTEAPGYGLPSGHVQQITILAFFLAGWFRRWWLWVLAIGGIALTMLERIYLGVHFVTDVLAGLLVGVLVLTGFFLWKQYRAPGYYKRILGQRLLITLIAPVLLTAVYLAILFIIGAPDLTVSWVEFIPTAETTTHQDMATGVGALVGFAIGIVLESSRICFRTDGRAWKRVGRYLLGAAVMAGLWIGLGTLLPNDPFWLALPGLALRSLIVALWVSYFWPWVFVRMGWAETDPEPEVRVSL